MTFLEKYGARVAARWAAVACPGHDRVVDLLRHLGRCPCHRHDAARCRTECARYGEGCPRGPLTQREVGRLTDAVRLLDWRRASALRAKYRPVSWFEAAPWLTGWSWATWPGCYGRKGGGIESLRVSTMTAGAGFL